MTFQTTYAMDPGIAYAGLLADAGDVDTISRVLAGAVALSAGLAAVFHAGDLDLQCRPPAATGEVTNVAAAGRLLGVAVFEPSAPNAPYAVGDQLSICKRGRIWVVAEEAVDPTSPVFVRFAAGGGGSVLGSFRKSADTATAVQAANGSAQYVTTQATPGGLVLLEINLP